MTVQGGGGGRKIPPGAGAAPTSPAARVSDAARAPTTTTPTAPGAAATRPRDGFDAASGERRPADRPLPAMEANTPSGIDSMLRVLEDTRAQILEEHRTLKPRIASLVGELAARGFERAVLEERGAELTALRTRMAALRRRLQQIQRRLRAVARTRVGDAHVGPQLASHLERLQTLEPGLERALVALQMMEIAFVEPWAGRSVKVVGDDAAAAGDALARALPGAAIASGVARLLGEGAATASSSASSSASSAPAPDTETDTDRLAALRDALKDSL